MGTDKVIFVGEQWGAPGSHVTGRGPSGTGSMLCTCTPFVKTQGHSSLRRMQCPFSIRHDVLPDVNSQLRDFDDDVDVFSQVISPVHGFSVFHSTDQIVHHLHSTVQDFPLW